MKQKFKQYTSVTRSEVDLLNLLNSKSYPAKQKKNDEALPYDQESDLIITFDIETSSAWLDDGKIRAYEKGISEKVWNRMIPLSIPYKWQISIEEEVIHGRDMKEFKEFLTVFPKNTHFIIWVHNLSWEFHFMLNYIQDWKSVFARNAHKPIYAIPEEFPNIEFRCSMMLTHMSLDAWGKVLGFEKLHSLDYNVIRTPLTPLTDEEMEYCQRDCEVVYVGIKKFRDKYKHVKSIPLTQTGQVRKEVKKRVRRDKRTLYKVIRLLPEDATMYRIYHKIFMGGFTHSNYALTGWTIREDGGGPAGDHRDFASSYPYSMMLFGYPVSPFTRDIFEREKCFKFCYILHLRLTDVRAKSFNHYLSSSKCENLRGGVYDNGRLIEAESMDVWITEVDLDIIEETYDFKVEILDCWRARKGYLPKVIIEYLLDLYENKTSLKGVTDEELPGAEDLYAESKQFINSVFGMSVTDLIQDEVKLQNGEWSVQYQTEKDVNDYLDDLKLHNKGRTFMAYQWGPYITAIARRNLFSCILGKDLSASGHPQLAPSNDAETIYCDTDSIFMRGSADFEWYDKLCDEKLQKMCSWYSIDFERTRPKDRKGIPHPLGHFTEEQKFSEFITLGAKRYCYRGAEDGKLVLTVSGVNKAAVTVLKDNIENFTNGLNFDKDHPDVRKMLHTYISNQPPLIWKEGEADEWDSSSITYSINLRPTGYKLTMTDEYLDLIDLEDMLSNFGNDQQSRLSIFG